MAFSLLWWVEQDSNPSVAARTSAAGDGLTEPNYYFVLSGQNAYRVLPPQPYRVFITDLSYGHSIFYVLMYEQALACSILCALGHILNCYALAGISGVVVTIVRDLNDTHEFVVDHNALSAVFTGAFRFIHINVVDQFPEQRCC